MACLALVALAIDTTAAPAPAVDPHIAAVESGLLPPARIAGRPAETWTLADRMAHHHVPGVSVAVIDRGVIAWSRGYGVARSGDPAPATPDTRFQAASLSKMVTAAAALSLVDSGRLALDADVDPLLKTWKIPDAPVANHEPVTLRRLLSHTAGFNVHGFAGYAAGTPVPTLPQVLDGLPPANSEPIRLVAEPGSVWRYSGGGYCVVQQLLADVSGEPFAALLREHVLTPARMDASTFAQPLPADLAAHAAAGHDVDGRPIPGDAHVYPELAAAGLWTTPSDLARFILALQHSRTASASPTLLSPASAAAMITPPLAGSDYGLGIGVVGAGENLQLTHSGANAGFRTLLVYYPQLGRGAVIMTNSDNGAPLATELLRAIAQAYDWPGYRTEEKTAFPLAPLAFDAFAGRYEREDTVLVFYSRGDRFYLRATNRPRVEVFPSSDHEFFLLDSPDTFVFERDASGETTHLIRHTPTGLQLFPRVQE
ncbi:MAG TPA: serine hydrolase [Opitutus sp.]|nr:serine hydrolase [Opitutus sp.]